MNREERLAIWQGHHANAKDRLDTVSQRHPGLDKSDPALYSKIVSGAQDSVKTAQNYIDFYT